MKLPLNMKNIYCKLGIQNSQVLKILSFWIKKFELQNYKFSFTCFFLRSYDLVEQGRFYQTCIFRYHRRCVLVHRHCHIFFSTLGQRTGNLNIYCGEQELFVKFMVSQREVLVLSMGKLNKMSKIFFPIPRQREGLLFI